MKTTEQLISEYKAKGGNITVCGKDRRHRTKRRQVNIGDITARLAAPTIPQEDRAKLLPKPKKRETHTRAIVIA